IKPLYYGRVGGDFVFASELKAVRKYPAFAGAIDRDALALYMRHGYIPSPHCIYEGLNKLPAGCILEVNAADGTPEIRKFWSAVEAARQGLENPVNSTDHELVEQLCERLTSAIGLRMISDVPLGAFLSGGVDSSLVVALMQAQSPRPVKTFTIGFHEDGYNEALHAKAVAQHLGTDHTELYVTPQDALNVVPLLPQMYDEPFADSSQIPTYLISKLARSHVTVSLSGDGGDELFAGYNRYLFALRLWNLRKHLPGSVLKLAASAIHAVSPETLDRAHSFVNPLFPRKYRLAAVGDKTHKLADFFLCESPEKIYRQALSTWSEPSQVVSNSNEPDTVTRSMNEASWLENFEDLMMLTDLQIYLPDDILTKVDRASMAV